MTVYRLSLVWVLLTSYEDHGLLGLGCCMWVSEVSAFVSLFGEMVPFLKRGHSVLFSSLLLFVCHVIVISRSGKEKRSHSSSTVVSEIDVDLLKLSSEMKLVMSLINPASTYMDLNIGITLWLDAGGDGCLQDETGSDDTFDHAK
ncbi:hypothetical protein FXO37_35689 [Capsicum annuum]|nr:hypothetical protein FXO37_35689 [Capsicum annuum]